MPPPSQTMSQNYLPVAISKALSTLPSLSHALGEVMLQGVATSHMASAEDGKSKFLEQVNC